MNSIKAVFFDLYGTLLVFNNFDKANNHWENVFYELAGKPNKLCFSEIQIICKEVLESDIEKDISAGLTTYETKIKKAFAERNIFFTINELTKIANETVGLWQKNIFLAEDTKDVLAELKKSKKLALITNFDHTPHIRKVLKETNLENVFDFVLISDEAGCKKPGKEIFKIALDKFSLDPEEAVYVGDNIYDDIKGAASAGINPVLISRNSKSNNHDNVDEIILKNNLPEFRIIKSLSELIPLLS